MNDLQRMKLRAMRTAIDNIDDQILTLLKKRVIVAGHIGEQKKRNNIPIVDEEREKEVLRRMTSNRGELQADDIVSIFSAIMLSSKKSE